MAESTHPRKEMPGGTRKVADLIAQWLEFKRHNQNRSARTEKAYGDCLGRMLEFFASIDRDPLSATDEDLVAFTGIWLHKHGVEAIARRPYIAAVRGFYRWLHSKKVIPSNPSAGVDYPRTGRKLPLVMTRRSAEAIMYAPDFNTFLGVRDGAILAVLFGCGLRIKGLTSLNESSLHQVDHDGEMRLVLKVVEKGDKERILPVPKEVAMILRLYLDHQELKAIDRTTRSGDKVLFVSINNRNVSAADYIGERRRISTRSVDDMIKKYGRRKGIPEEELHAHAMRHLFGTELAESDVALLLAQDLLGHEDPKHTKIYAHVALRKKIQESDRANPLAKIRTPMGDILKQIGKGTK